MLTNRMHCWCNIALEDLFKTLIQFSNDGCFIIFDRVNTADPVHFTLTPPECHMEIRNGYGTSGTRVTGPVHVGDPLTLLILMRSQWGEYYFFKFIINVN